MNYEEFCELAPLYVLDVLDAKERRLLEDYIAQFPESEAHLDELAETLAMMPYSLPERTMATNLKARLFERIADETVADSHQSITYPAMGTHLPLFTVKPADVRWQPHPVPGVAIAKLYEDPVRREIVCLLRAQAGVYYPCHRHVGAEEIFMLEGDLVVNGEVYGTGDYIRSAPGTIHNPHTVNGCMFFIRTSLDDEILN